MTVEQFYPSGEGKINSNRFSNLDETNSGRPSNQGGNLDEGEITHGQPPRDERGAGAINDESGQTKAESMNEVLSPLWLRLRKLRRELGNCIIGAAGKYLEKYLKSPNINDSYKEFLEEELANLRSFLDTVSGNPKGTEGLEIMIRTAFKCIRRLGRDDDTSRQLAGLLVEIAEELRQAVFKMTSRKQFSYETRTNLLNELISLIVELILNVGPNDSGFRGRKPKEDDTYHPNNAFLRALYVAAYEWVFEATARATIELNNRQELINAISRLLEITQKLRFDELMSIYSKILVRIYGMINQQVEKNGDIDDDLVKQVADLYINYFAKSLGGINQFAREVFGPPPSNLKLLKIFSGKLADLARKTGSTDYWDMVEYLNEVYLVRETGNTDYWDMDRFAGETDYMDYWDVARCLSKSCFNRNKGLEEENAGLEEENAGLEESIDRKIAELEEQVQELLKQIGIQTDEEK